MMAVNNPDQKDDTKTVEAEIRNNFKYYDPIRNPYNKDGQSYKDLADMKVPSGVIDKGKIQNSTGNIMVPYISEDGRTAVKIKNGRIYFGSGKYLISTINNATLIVMYKFITKSLILSSKNMPRTKIYARTIFFFAFFGL